MATSSAARNHWPPFPGKRHPAREICGGSSRQTAEVHCRQPGPTTGGSSPQQTLGERVRQQTPAADKRGPRQTAAAYGRSARQAAEARDRPQAPTTESRSARQTTAARDRQRAPASDSRGPQQTTGAHDRREHPAPGATSPRPTAEAHDGPQKSAATDSRATICLWQIQISRCLCEQAKRRYVWLCANASMQMDTLGIEPRASRMLSGCDTTTPCALRGIFHAICYTQIVAQLRGKTSATARRGRRRGRTDGVDGKATGPRAPESV